MGHAHFSRELLKGRTRPLKGVFLQTHHRKGSRLGHDTIIDGMLKDCLRDVYNDFGMGICGEICVDQYSITRQEQDSYAIRSFECGIAAQNVEFLEEGVNHQLWLTGMKV